MLLGVLTRQLAETSYRRNYTWAQVHAFLSVIENPPNSNLQPRFNICPTTQVDVVYDRTGQRELIQARWGLIPAWWSKPLREFKLATFNARAETKHRPRSPSRPSMIATCGLFDLR